MTDDKDKTFKVTDKRSFSDSEKESGESQDAKEQEKGKTEPEERKIEPSGDVPRFKIDFLTFVSSLHASAMVHLGLMPDPSGNDRGANLEIAKQNIDILEMVEEKTKGNLSPDEKSILENILFDLRMKYVELTKKKG